MYDETYTYFANKLLFFIKSFRIDLPLSASHTFRIKKSVTIVALDISSIQSFQRKPINVFISNISKQKVLN